MSVTDYLPGDFLELYEAQRYRHALEVLSTGCRNEFAELIGALMRFRLTTDDITAQGGNESKTPKRVAALLRPMRWFETRIRGDLVVTIETHTDAGTRKTETRLDDFMDGHEKIS